MSMRTRFLAEGDLMVKKIKTSKSGECGEYHVKPENRGRNLQTMLRAALQLHMHRLFIGR